MQVVGGQALIEGVFFKSKKAVSYAVRDMNGKIVSKAQKYMGWSTRLGVTNIPILRGMVAFFEMLVIGTKYLNISANIATGEKEDNGFIGFVSVLLGFAIALALFKLLPFYIGLLAPTQYLTTVEGIVKLVVLIGYIVVIGQFADIKRVFEYHGAEHKAIRCYEAGLPLTVANVAKQTRYHPRCGTSFLVVVVLLSIILYTLIPISASFLVAFGIRLLLLPVLAGVSFELLMLTANAPPELAWIQKPGFWVQSLTTREPKDDQIAVAIVSLKKCLALTKD
jgi:uncharacterized protein YqhQ